MATIFVLNSGMAFLPKALSKDSSAPARARVRQHACLVQRRPSVSWFPKISDEPAGPFPLGIGDYPRTSCEMPRRGRAEK